MPTIGSGRIVSGTGKIIFGNEPVIEANAVSPVTTRTRASATAVGDDAAGPPGERGEDGLPGPPGPAGPATDLTISSVTLDMAASIGATDSSLLAAISGNLLCVAVSAETTGPVQNYLLSLYDGDPGDGGALIYQATGITAASYHDGLPFYILITDSIWVQVTNIDADLTTVTVTLRHLVLAT